MQKTENIHSYKQYVKFKSYMANYKHYLYVVCLQLVSELTIHIQRFI
jgi:hypothetical protein